MLKGINSYALYLIVIQEKSRGGPTYGWDFSKSFVLTVTNFYVTLMVIVTDTFCGASLQLAACQKYGPACMNAGVSTFVHRHCVLNFAARCTVDTDDRVHNPKSITLTIHLG